MGDLLHHVWQCPLCGRRVPANIDTCRCGLARDRAESSRPEPPGTTRIASAAPKEARTLVVALAALVLAATGATALMVLISKRAAPPTPATSQKIRVLSRLDDFTRKAGPKVRNTIPGFLAISGRLGVLEDDPDDSTSARVIKQISEVELAKGICTPSVPVIVRHLYPGEYDNWPDVKLERTVLAKHPEYRDKLCILPLWIEATPHDIVKYELTLQPAAAPARP